MVHYSTRTLKGTFIFSVFESPPTTLCYAPANASLHLFDKALTIRELTAPRRIANEQPFPRRNCRTYPAPVVVEIARLSENAIAIVPSLKDVTERFR